MKKPTQDDGLGQQIAELIDRVADGYRGGARGLANAMHVAESTVSKWRKGKAQIKAPEFVKLARLVGISVDELITRLPPDAREIEKQYRALETRLQSVEDSVDQLQGLVKGLLGATGGVIAVDSKLHQDL